MTLDLEIRVVFEGRIQHMSLWCLLWYFVLPLCTTLREILHRAPQIDHFLCLLITLINSCPSQTIVESIGGALSAFWCQGGQPANCSPGCPEWSHSSQMIPPLYTVLHTGFERRLWNLVEIRGVPLLRHQGACPTWPRNFIEIFPPCLQRITTFHWNRNLHQISQLKGDSPK